MNVPRPDRKLSTFLFIENCQLKTLLNSKTKRYKTQNLFGSLRFFDTMNRNDLVVGTVYIFTSLPHCHIEKAPETLAYTVFTINIEKSEIAREIDFLIPDTPFTKYLLPNFETDLQNF